MSISVDHDKCIGCGSCASICPKGFAINDEGKSDPITQEVLDCTHDAADACPVQAITVSE
ncbi:ferredoxin [Candidatus Parcubacteria bacterium]|nr:MAG: ferredoxin [Candidatus Parcubacteria bacterium]